MAEVLNNENFDEKVIKSDKLCMVDFWAPWCGPCVRLSPTIDALSAEYEGKVNVGKVNVDENPDLSEKYGIKGIPCVLFIKNGEVVDRQVGASAKTVYEGKIGKILNE